MNAGKMDRKITVQVRTATQDGTGGRVESWADSFDTWAELVQQRATEAVRAAAERTHEILQFRIRYKAGLGAATHRVLYQLRFFNIVSIIEEGRKDKLLLTCESVQAVS